jgi:pimeloyl-ACP methyl ester carboxylesterase
MSLLLHRAGGLAIAAVLLASAPACGGPIRDQIYYPEPMPATMPVWAGRAPQEVSVTTADGLTLHAFWWPPEKPDGQVVVFFHGNAGQRAGWAKTTEAFAADGRGLLVADYRGYGGNPGQPTEKGLFADGDAFMAKARALAPDAKLYVLGYSLGGAVALEMAGRHKVDGVVTVSTFTSLADVAPVYARPFLPDRYDSRAAITRVTAPIVMFHGTKDELIPFKQRDELAGLAKVRVRVVTMNGAGHHVNLAKIIPLMWQNLDDLSRPAPAAAN